MVHAEFLIVTQNLVLDGLLVADEKTVAGEVLQGAVGALRGVEAEGVEDDPAIADARRPPDGGFRDRRDPDRRSGFCAGFRLVPCPAIV